MHAVAMLTACSNHGRARHRARPEALGLAIPCELLEITPGLFRPRYEDGSFVRVERDDDGRHWEVRTKAGVILELGGDGFEESEGARYRRTCSVSNAIGTATAFLILGHVRRTC